MPLFLLAPLHEVFCFPLPAKEVVADEVFPEASSDLPPLEVGPWHCALELPFSIGGAQRGTCVPALLPPQDLVQCLLPSGCCTNVS